MVYALLKGYEKRQTYHEMITLKDYINEPKASGYRGIHLVYKYFSDKKETYNGLSVEIQLRSAIQHAWATAVEAAGTFLRFSLKSNRGPQEWLDFFKIVSSGFSIIEKSSLVPGVEANPAALKKLISEETKRLDVVRKISFWGSALTINHEEMPGAFYYLLILMMKENKLEYQSFKKNELQRATAEYMENEKRYANDPHTDVVLVSVGSLESLKQAYPNYFMDTNKFIHYLNQIINF